MEKDKAIFLDRDGVVCKALNPNNDGKNGYLINLEEFELLPGIEKLIETAKRKDYKVIVVTNQTQTAKRFLSQEKLHEIHLKMQNSLGNRIDKIYYCPHLQEDDCEHRKPKPGMLNKASRDFDIDLSALIKFVYDNLSNTPFTFLPPCFKKRKTPAFCSGALDNVKFFRA